MTKASSKFWDRIAAKYAKSPLADQAAYDKKLAITQGYFNPQMEVLEIGCGTGTTSLFHAPHVRHVLATDISGNMIQIAQDKANAQGISNVTFQTSAIDDLDIADQSVDMVMAHSILHLVEDRNAVIARIHQWLKPGGVFVSSTICMADAYAFMRPILPLGRVLGLLPLVRFFREADLVGGITDVGFHIDYQWKPTKKAAVFVVALKKE